VAWACRKAGAVALLKLKFTLVFVANKDLTMVAVLILF